MTILLIFIAIFIGTYLLFLILNKNLKAYYELVSFLTFLLILALEVLLYLFVDFSIFENLSFLILSVIIFYIYYSVKHPSNSLFFRSNENKIERIADSICLHKKALFQRIKSDGDLSDYFYLKLEYEKGNVKNKNFQERYKSFYRMHLFGFTPEFYNKYFQFLREGETDLKKILEELSKIKNESGKKTVQLAFASKLIHMVDNTKPLYNSTVSDIFNISVRRGSIKVRIKSSLEAYSELEKNYQELLENEKIREVIDEFRKKLNFKEGILSDYKLLDLILHKLKKV